MSERTKLSLFKTIEFDGFQIRLSLYEYHLELRSAFGTSHSSTTHRTNALIGISIKIGTEEWNGFGECGLPPKKPKCYLADFSDIKLYFEQYCSHVEEEFAKLDLKHVNLQETMEELFDGLLVGSSKYFTQLQSLYEKSHVPASVALPLILLKCLDKYQYVDKEGRQPEFEHCAQCGIEMSIFDLWGKVLKQPLYAVIGIDAPKEKFSFYTAALNEDISEIVKTAKFGLEKTKHLKIKLDGNVEKGILILKNLYDTYERDFKLGVTPLWSIDANAAWTPEISLQFLATLKEQIPQFLPYFFMLEQPFPITVDNAEDWIKVKQCYEKENILIFADESVNTFDNIPSINPFIHGINIKLEKSGGIRGALKTANIAKSTYHLKLWFGCMVSSRLSCTCSSHLMSLSEIGGDLDGDLLITENSQAFTGGFEWRRDASVDSKLGPHHGEIKLQNQDLYGIGLTPKLDW